MLTHLRYCSLALTIGIMMPQNRNNRQRCNLRVRWCAIINPGSKMNLCIYNSFDNIRSLSVVVLNCIPLNQVWGQLGLSCGCFLSFCSFYQQYPVIFSCDRAGLRTLLSVRSPARLSVFLSHLFHYVPLILSSWIFYELLSLTKVMSKVMSQR